MTENAGFDPESLAQGHELQDVRPRLAVWAAVTILICSVAMHLALGAGFRWLKHRFHSPYESAADRRITLPPEPRIKSDFQTENRAYLEAQRQLLSRHEWIDRGSGIARIPIEEAMEVYAKAR